ncbi:MAG: helix-turn-helix domain-containing protein, partial [Myxococcota bacterium]
RASPKVALGWASAPRAFVRRNIDASKDGRRACSVLRDPMYECLDWQARTSPPPSQAPLPEPANSLEAVVLARLRAYAQRLQGYHAADMYALIMPQLERPLMRVAMELARGRQNHAADMLGIHRNTLRTKLRALGLSADHGRRGGS